MIPGLHGEMKLLSVNPTCPESTLMIGRSFDNMCFDNSPLSFFLAFSLYLSLSHPSPGEVMRTWMFSYLCDRHLHPPV